MKKIELIRQIDILLEQQKEKKIKNIVENVLNETESYNDYPESAVNNAKKALKWKEEHGDEVKGGTRVGWERANQLANKENLTKDTIKRMHSFFSRHEAYQDPSEKKSKEPWKEASLVSHLLWGGDSAKNWAARKVKQFKKDK
ncbi:MAG: hypothetical protein ACOC33_03070 [bacterium]